MKLDPFRIAEVEAAAHLLARAVLQPGGNAVAALYERKEFRRGIWRSPWNEREIGDLNRLFQDKAMGLGVFGTSVGHTQNGELFIRVYANREGIAHLKEYVLPRFRPNVHIPIVIAEVGSLKFAKSSSCCGGASISALSGSQTGTLGAWLKRNPSLAFVGISNNHVLSEFGKFAPGHKVIHPGAADGGTSADVIGEIEGVVPMKKFDPGQYNATLNHADVAWFKPDKDKVVDQTVGGRGRTPSGEEDLVQAFYSGAPVNVWMSGKSSSPPDVYGQVSGVRAVFCIQDAAMNKYIFEDQIEVTMNRVADGDSGAIICTDYNKIGGLFFALEIGRPGVGIVNPWDAVKQATGLSFHY